MKSSEYILNISKDYSIYVCESRSIPKIADGLKDAQRKALWLMKSRSDKIKTISLAGEMISSNLYLHGDISASGAISMLAAPFCNNKTLLDGIGQFGSRVSPVDGIGAPRYTYVKKSKNLDSLLYVDLDIVPLIENYDGSVLEPKHFLPLIPLVLLNGVSGIAVGWSTEILPRRLNDIIDACISTIDGKKIKPLKPHYEYLKCDITHDQDSSWFISGKVEIIDTSTAVVTELPPDLTLEKFKERLNNFEEQGKINSYTDNSTKTINIKVKFLRGSLKDTTTNDLIDFFKLKQRKTERIVVIDWNCNSIKQYDNSETVISEFVKWRFGWFTVRYNKMIEDSKYELSFWNAMKLCFDKKLPNKLLSLNSKKEIEEEIQNIVKDNIDISQINKIAGLPSYRWAKDYYQEVLKNIENIEKNILFFNELLNDESKLWAKYREELIALKKAIT